MPTPSCNGKLYRQGEPIDYIHYSLVMQEDRKTALFTAHNIDGDQIRSVKRTGWNVDSRVGDAQLGPQVYKYNEWDRGHLVRRAAVAWGPTEQRAKDASDSTFYYSNAAPQHERFNQDEWVDLEDWVLRKATGFSSRVCVFTGPIYTTGDVYDDGTRIPSAFFKVVALVDGGDLAVLGFVMKQNELWEDWDGADTHDLQVYQVSIKSIGEAAGLNFGELANLDEFVWRSPRFRDGRGQRPVLIGGADDISLSGSARRRIVGVRATRTAPPEETAAASGSASSAPADGYGCGCEGGAEPVAMVKAMADEITNLRGILDYLMAKDAMGARGTDDDRAALGRLRSSFDRIVGGKLARAGAFTDCVCLGHDDGSGDIEFFCTGVLISPEVVLTAAHCAPNGINRVFLAGNAIRFLADGEIREVKQVIVHPDYDGYAVPSHDIAIVILAEPSAKATPVVLASEDELREAGDTNLVGFGYNHPTQPWGFGTKREVNVGLTSPVALSPAAFEEAEERHGFAGSHEFHADNKYDDKDSCNGDSGGPAYVWANNAIKLAGLTSRAAYSALKSCGDGGIYTKVGPYRAWIAQVTGDDSFLAGGAGGGVVDGGGVPDAGLGGPYVSAVLPNPPSSDSGREWVEVSNNSTEDVDLSGWHIEDRQRGKEHLSGVLLAGKTHRVVLPSSSKVKLGNKGDEVALFNGDAEIHRVGYVSAKSGVIFQYAAPKTPAADDDDDSDGGADSPEISGLQPDPC